MPKFGHLGSKLSKTNGKFEISTFKLGYMRNFVKIRLKIWKSKASRKLKISPILQFWVVSGRFAIFWGSFRLTLGRFGWFRLVLAGFGSFWLITSFSKYVKKPLNIEYCHDDEKRKKKPRKIPKNVWGYCKEVFDKKHIVKTGFNKEACPSFFKKTLTRNKKKWKFEFPASVKELNEPLNLIDLKPPTYKKITGIIDKLKSSGSPCPQDQTSIIILKRCLTLKTFIHKIISHCWRERKFPSCWKQAFTVWIHKKGFNMEPSNFLPITFQAFFAKIYSSLIRKRIYNFLLENQLLSRTYRKVSVEQYQGQ